MPLQNAQRASQNHPKEDRRRKAPIGLVVQGPREAVHLLLLLALKLDILLLARPMRRLNGTATRTKGTNTISKLLRVTSSAQGKLRLRFSPTAGTFAQNGEYRHLPRY